MTINRKAIQFSDGEDSEEDFGRRRKETTARNTVNVKAGRLETNVDDVLAKARQRAARFAQVQQTSLQSATVESSNASAIDNRDGNCSKDLQPTNSFSVVSRCDQNDSSVTMVEKGNEEQRVFASAASSRRANRGVEMSVSVTENKVASGSREAVTAEDKSVKKMAPFIFRKPTTMRGPSQKTFKVYFTEPQLKNDNVEARQQISVSPPARSLFNAQSSSSQRLYGGSQKRSQQTSTPYRFTDYNAKQKSYSKASFDASQKYHKGRGFWRGRGVGRFGRMKNASVGIEKGPIRQTRLVLNPLQENDIVHESSAYAYRHSSPIASTAGRHEAYTPSRASFPEQRETLSNQSRHQLYSSSNASEHSFRSQRPLCNVKTGNRLPHSSTIRDILEEEAASTFTFRRPLNAIDAANQSASSPDSFHKEIGSDRRTLQYETGVFNQDPARELQMSKSRLNSYRWNSNESTKLLKTASLRSQVPSTPRQGYASKSRRGTFDPSTVLQSHSSSPHASSSRIRMSTMQSSASLGSSQIHGPNSNTRNTSAAIVIESEEEEEFDDGGFQDEDLADLDTRDYY